MADRRGSARTRAAAPFLAGLLALALVACATFVACATPAATSSQATSSVPSPVPTLAATVSPPPATSPSAAATGISAATGCGAADLKASHGLVEGAAGSVLTEVVLVAQRACSVDGNPALGIRDAHGAELVAGTAAASGRIDLEPNVSYSSNVRFGNWCNPAPTFPLALVVRIGAGEVKVTGTSFPDEGDMPPCNGDGGPVLEATAWSAAP